MSKRVIVFVALSIVAAIAVIKLYPWPEDDSKNHLTLYGNVDIREVRLSFRVPGRLKSMLFEEGDTITSGTLVATLDDKPLREALTVANALVNQAQAQLDRLKNGTRPQEIQQANAKVQETTAALHNAKLTLKRQNELMTAGVGSQHNLDAAITSRDRFAAQLKSNKKALELAEEGPRKEDVAAAEAALAAAVAQARQRQTQLDDTELYAPNVGTVLTRVREPGAMLGIAEPVYVLSLTETIYIRAYVAETELGNVVPGTIVKVKTDSSNKYYEGQVGFVSPRAEFTPKTVETPELRSALVYRLRIVVNDADKQLRQGMPVTIELPSPVN